MQIFKNTIINNAEIISMQIKLILFTSSLLLTFNLVCPYGSQANTKELDIDISNSSDRALRASFADRLIEDKELEQNITKTSPKTENEIIFDKIISNLSKNNISSQSLGNIMQKVAENFLGAKYKAGLLDRFNKETLVISLTEFDCLLFIETVLALSRNLALQEYNYQAFANNIVNQRYWNGNLNGYCSRLHYFSEWIYDNHKRNNIEDISITIGGISQQKKLDFMSKHRSSYPRLIQDDTNYQCIVNMEKNLTIQGVPTNYIPKQEIKNIYQQLKPGDIIGVTTNIEGLDVTHTGLAYSSADGKVGFIHASPIGTVTIARDLQNYVEHISKSTGIVVARPIDPRIKR